MDQVVISEVMLCFDFAVESFVLGHVFLTSLNTSHLIVEL